MSRFANFLSVLAVLAIVLAVAAPIAAQTPAVELVVPIDIDKLTEGTIVPGNCAIPEQMNVGRLPIAFWFEGKWNTRNDHRLCYDLQSRVERVEQWNKEENRWTEVKFDHKYPVLLLPVGGDDKKAAEVYAWWLQEQQAATAATTAAQPTSTPTRAPEATTTPEPTATTVVVEWTATPTVVPSPTPEPTAVTPSPTWTPYIVYVTVTPEARVITPTINALATAEAVCTEGCTPYGSGLTWADRFLLLTLDIAAGALIIALLTFILNRRPGPMGPQGLMGLTGPQGETGKSVYFSDVVETIRNSAFWRAQVVEKLVANTEFLQAVAEAIVTLQAPPPAETPLKTGMIKGLGEKALERLTVIDYETVEALASADAQDIQALFSRKVPVDAWIAAAQDLLAKKHDEQ